MVAKVSKLQKGVELQKRLNRKKFPGVSENCVRCENHRTLLRLENANQNQLNFIDTSGKSNLSWKSYQITLVLVS